MKHKKIAFFLPNLAGGGAERVAINLLKGMSELDLDLDLVVGTAEGPYLAQISSKIRLVSLDVSRIIKAIVPLANYLKQEQPTALISHMGHTNSIALLAKKLAKTSTKVIVVEHNPLSIIESKLWRSRVVPWFMKILYPQANAIVAVSDGVARDMELQLDWELGTVKTIYNPVIDRELIHKSKTPPDHPWLQTNEIPVFLAIGRLSPQKDFGNLLKAFARLREKTSARLLVLGEGDMREQLQLMAHELKIAQDTAFPGFVDNPYAYMTKARAFILSSRSEGLPTVLIEAMACGCPVVSTDCPYGPAEILEGGLYGALVPVSDSFALSEAMLQTLKTPIDSNKLKQRASYFSLEKVVPQYLSLVESN